MRKKPGLEIFSFFSFKGGSGRSLGLSNAALELANRGYRVACVDLDIEAPGLSSIFGITDTPRIGVVDLMLDVNSAFGRVEEAVLDVSDLLDDSSNGALFLLPALNASADTLDELAWDQDLTPEFKRQVLDVIGGLKRLDYILIDSKSGLTHEAVFAFTLATRVSIFFCRLDRQSRLGTLYARDQLATFFDLETIFVANDVPPNSTKAKLVKEQFEVQLKQPFDVIIPSDADMQIEEELVVKTRPEAAVSKGYKKLVDKMVDSR